MKINNNNPTPSSFLVLPKLLGSFFLLLFFSACVEKESQTVIETGKSNTEASFDFNISEGFPLPRIPEDNPISESKFQLGRHLFYDTKLSGNQTMSCASCHHQDKAFADGLALPTGSTGMVHPRNSQALVNIAYNSTVNWANPTTVTLEQQALVPIFGEFPVELGVSGDNQDEVLARFVNDLDYQAMFAAAFPNEDAPIHFNNIAKALASFGRGLNSFNSPYDQYLAGDDTAISESAKRGLALFESEQMECFHCHGGDHLSAASTDATQIFTNSQFHNNGLYNIAGTGDYPEGGQGLYEITAMDSDKGKFRPPTLRNIALTAPYMHDGSLSTLEEVALHYAAGGRNITEGEHFGDGRANPNKSSMVAGFEATEQDIQDLIAFMESLTDVSFTTNPRFSNPFE